MNRIASRIALHGLAVLGLASVASLAFVVREPTAIGCAAGGPPQEATEQRIYSLSWPGSVEAVPTNAPVLLGVLHKGLTPAQLLAALSVEVTQGTTPVSGTLSYLGETGESTHQLTARNAVVLWRPTAPFAASTTYRVRVTSPAVMERSFDLTTGAGPLLGVEPTEAYDTAIHRYPTLSGPVVTCQQQPGSTCGPTSFYTKETFRPTLTTHWKNGSLTAAQQSYYAYEIEPSEALAGAPTLRIGGAGPIAFKEPTGTYCYRVKATNLADGQSVTSEPLCATGPMADESVAYKGENTSCQIDGYTTAQNEALRAQQCADYQQQCDDDCQQSPTGCGTAWCNNSERYCGEAGGAGGTGGSSGSSGTGGSGDQAGGADVSAGSGGTTVIAAGSGSSGEVPPKDDSCSTAPVGARSGAGWLAALVLAVGARGRRRERR